MKHMIRNRYGTNIRSYELLPLLGLKPKGHLPTDGMPEREIQGVRIYVKPYVQRPPRHNASKHRVMAICKCGRHISVGRLHQHLCAAQAVDQLLGPNNPEPT